VSVANVCTQFPEDFSLTELHGPTHTIPTTAIIVSTIQLKSYTLRTFDQKEQAAFITAIHSFLERKMSKPLPEENVSIKEVREGVTVVFQVSVEASLAVAVCGYLSIGIGFGADDGLVQDMLEQHMDVRFQSNYFVFENFSKRIWRFNPLPVQCIRFAFVLKKTKNKKTKLTFTLFFLVFVLCFRLRHTLSW
jgi:hypothetical protein